MSDNVSRVASWIVGVSAYKAVDYAFDYVLYPWAVYALGPLKGGAVMAAASLGICLLYLRAYDYFKRDWLGIEVAKSLREYGGPSRWRRLLASILRRSDLVAFVLLSLRFDPFVTTAYMRRGSYSGMSARDWWVFFGSLVVSNGIWTALCAVGASALHAFSS